MNAAERSANLYDEVLYPAAVHVHTAPDRLATVGVLRGMQPARVDHSRVLELGCGVGTNLISMAFNNPHSRFLGIDLAHGPIAAGQKSVSALGLKNIELEPLDLVPQGSFRDFANDAHQAMSQVQSADSVTELLQTAVTEIRRITG